MKKRWKTSIDIIKSEKGGIVMFWKKHTDYKADPDDKKNCLKQGNIARNAKKEREQRKWLQDREIQKWNAFDELMEDLDQYN